MIKVKRYGNPLRLLIAVSAMLLWIGCTDRNLPTTNPVQPMDVKQFQAIVTDTDFSGLAVVFASWCRPCRRELPELTEVYHAFSSKGIRVISVSVDDGDTSKVQSLVNRLQLPYPVYHVGTALVPEYRLVGVPTLLVFHKGKVVENSPGQQSAQSLTEKVMRLMAIPQSVPVQK